MGFQASFTKTLDSRKHAGAIDLGKPCPTCNCSAQTSPAGMRQICSCAVHMCMYMQHPPP